MHRDKARSCTLAFTTCFWNFSLDTVTIAGSSLIQYRNLNVRTLIFQQALFDCKELVMLDI